MALCLPTPLRSCPVSPLEVPLRTLTPSFTLDAPSCRYLRPTDRHLAVVEYVTPAQFDWCRADVERKSLGSAAAPAWGHLAPAGLNFLFLLRSTLFYAYERGEAACGLSRPGSIRDPRSSMGVTFAPPPPAPHYRAPSLCLQISQHAPLEPTWPRVLAPSEPALACVPYFCFRLAGTASAARRWVSVTWRAARWCVRRIRQASYSSRQ